MQDVIGLRDEVLEATRTGAFGRAKLRLSGDIWCPVVALDILDFVLPPGLLPYSVNICLPIPRLYGFARSINVALLQGEISRKCIDGRREALPGIKRVMPSHFKQHSAAFAGLRSKERDPAESYYIFISPHSDKRGFVHRPVAQFLIRLAAFIRAPEEFLRAEIRYCREVWVKSNDPWWLLRMSELQTDVGDVEAGRRSLLHARDRFPLHEEFAAALEAWNLSPRQGPTDSPDLDEECR